MKLSESSASPGNRLVLAGTTRSLIHHPTDFSVIQLCSRVRDMVSGPSTRVSPLASKLSRVSASDSGQRDELMKRIRQEHVAHHIYQSVETSEEVVIADE